MSERTRLSAIAPMRRILSASMLSAAAVVGGCAVPEHEVLYKAYADCLDDKKAVESCHLEKAKYEAAATRAQIQATRGASAAAISRPVYTPPPTASVPPPVVVTPPTYMSPMRYGRTW